MAITLAEKEAFLLEAKAAYKKALNAKNYSVANGGGSSRAITRQELSSLLTQITYWETEIKKEKSSSSGIQTKFITSAGDNL